jgi:serine/threonine protein kinase/tetratricopeptide (TPR) repeat protein
MTSSEQREEEVFAGAVQLPPDQRSAYLDRTCADDDALRQRIETLLGALERAAPLLREPPPTLPSFGRPSLQPAEKPGDRIDRYKLLEQIGEGGCGVVYVAEQEEPVRRRVALKVIKLGMDTKQIIARFDAERQALAMMDHPNIAKVLDGGATETGRPYFVMELVHGIKITDYCDQNQLAPRERLDLFIQVCRAIQHAHQKGIIHRDIKPSNILVTLHDGVAVPKVIDFGIAKATQGRLTDQTVYTAFEQFIGTPAYMSPEQAEMSGLDIDTRSDIYSLGVLLYELLTGKTPFDAKKLLAAGLDEMRRTIREVEPIKPSTRLTQEVGRVAPRAPSSRENSSESGAHGVTRPTSQPSTLNSQQLKDLIHLLRGDLDWIVMKCLEKDRTRRYETANGLATDIARHLSNEPIVARPPSKLYRFQKSVQRNKLAFGAATAVALALVTGFAASTAMFFKTQAEKKKAQTAAAKSEQVAQFLKDMLEGVGPSVALGRDTVMLQEILNETAERLSLSLTNQPEIEGELRNTLGRVYFELGQYQKAEAMHRDALALYRKQLGGENLFVAESLDGVANAVWKQGRSTEAETLYREALAMRRKLLGREHPDIAHSLHSLANALLGVRKLKEAEALYREALAMQTKLLGDKSAEVTGSLVGLALVLMGEGKLGEAETKLREALKIQRELFGDQHPHVAWTLFDLGATLHRQGKLAEAETVAREALAMRRNLLGGEHPEVAMSLQALADLLSQEGKLPESEAAYREALAIRTKLLGVEHPATAGPLRKLTGQLLEEGKTAEARALLEGQTNTTTGKSRSDAHQ